jgi:hypothetical protein
MRGGDFFRDTFLGEDRFNDNPSMKYGNSEKNAAFAARHLAGVWATAPYLHNGSVKNIYELLLPETKRRNKLHKINISANILPFQIKYGFCSIIRINY